MTVEVFDIGNSVVCEFCGQDYTNSDEKGGFIFESKGVCPRCAPSFMSKVIGYNEQSFIRGSALPGEQFRDFILRSRGGNNTVTITSGDDFLAMMDDLFQKK
jgi:hypothetical protein